MNRRSIFSGIAALFAGGVARGQKGGTGTVTGEGDITSVPSYVVRTGPTTSKLTYGAPNQCPVCGQVAEPYKRPTELEAYGSAACLSEGTNAVTYSVCVRPSDTKLTGPMERITRCRRCSSAFWQDAKE